MVREVHDDVIIKWLEREAANRYSNADEIASGFVRQTGPSVSPAGATRTIQFQVRRIAANHRIWIIPGSLALILAVIVQA